MATPPAVAVAAAWVGVGVVAACVGLWLGAAAGPPQAEAMSANPAVGFAAYYAAAREFPGRDITLRHKDRVLSRWTGRSH